MNKLKTATLIVIILGMAASFALFVQLPEWIPAHYNLKGEVTRMGSKFEFLLMPVTATLFGLAFRYWAGRRLRKGLETDARVLYWAAIIGSVVLFGIGLSLGAGALHYHPGDGPQVITETAKYINLILGLLLIVFGNYLPKLRRNAVMGLRTRWSMANDNVWQKSQRFGGLVSMITGFVLILGTLFTKGSGNYIFCLVVILIDLAVSIYGSYAIYQREAQ